MTIGIITQRLGMNYGGVLQNYALQQALISLGHNPITFDINAPTWYSWIQECVKFQIKRIIGMHTFPVSMSPYKTSKVERPLRRFIKKHIAMTSPIQTIEKKHLSKYGIEAIFVGSDQVWRPMFSNIPQAFGEFAEGMNIPFVAYAVSFGVDWWMYDEEQTRRCARLAKQFKAISIREQSGVELCKKHLGVKAVQMPDPTFLLEATVYLKLCDSAESNSHNCIFAYILDIDPKKDEYIKEMSHIVKLPVLLKEADNHIEDSDSIERWLSCFKNCSIVITDSFHGTIFSIIFNKDFYVMGNDARGTTRIKTLLKAFGLENRIVSADDLERAIPKEKITWGKINKIMAEEREKGLNYISTQLSLNNNSNV